MRDHGASAKAGALLGDAREACQAESLRSTPAEPDTAGSSLTQLLSSRGALQSLSLHRPQSPPWGGEPFTHAGCPRWTRGKGSAWSECLRRTQHTQTTYSTPGTPDPSQAGIGHPLASDLGALLDGPRLPCSGGTHRPGGALLDGPWPSCSGGPQTWGALLDGPRPPCSGGPQTWGTLLDGPRLPCSGGTHRPGALSWTGHGHPAQGVHRPGHSPGRAYRPPCSGGAPIPGRSPGRATATLLGRRPQTWANGLRVHAALKRFTNLWVPRAMCRWSLSVKS